jgi:hypothetical protein
MKNWQSWGPVVAVLIAVGVFVWWSNQHSDGEGDTRGTVPQSWQQPDRTNACAGIVGATPAARTSTCLGKLASSRPSSEARKAIDAASKDGKTFVAARVDVGGNALRAEDHPELVTALLGSDEQKAAKALIDAGVTGAVVARDLTGALDRDALVLARLANHDFLEWFQLHYITADLFVYSVRRSPSRMPLNTGAQLLAGLRSRLYGERPVPQSWHPEAVRMIGSVRLQGDTLGARHTVKGIKDGIPADRVLEVALDELATDLRVEWERHIQTMGFGSLPERRNDIRLEVQVVTERAPVEPRSRFQIFDLWELGIDGMILKNKEGAKDEKFVYFPGSEAIARSIHTADDFLTRGVQGTWRDQRPWEDEAVQLDLIRTQHFMEREPGGGTGAVYLFRNMPEVPMAHVTDRNVQSMLVSGAEWWLENQYRDGSFEYKYWPEQNRRSDEYNEVRHELGIRDLADTFRYRRDPRYLAGSRLGLQWLNQYLVSDTDPPAPAFQLGGRSVTLPHPPPGSVLFRYPKIGQGAANQKLGTVAVGVLAVVALADASESHEYDELLTKLG